MWSARRPGPGDRPAGRRRGRDHRVEHLRRDDHGLCREAAGADELLLAARHLLLRDLDAEIAARAAHPERRDPRWQAHLQRRLAAEGHADLTTMYVLYQQEMQAMLARQPVASRLLPPQQ